MDLSLAPETFEWIYPPTGLTLNTDWRQQGEEWLHHLRLAITGAVSSTSFSSKSADPSDLIRAPHLLIWLEGSELKSKLAVVRLQAGGVWVALVGDSDPDEGQTKPWLEALDTATQKTGKHQREFAWTALIGTAAQVPSGVQQLEVEAQIGTVRLRPGRVMMWERVDPQLPSLAGWRIQPSAPVIVEGPCHGYAWDVASIDAAGQLTRLCQMLSIAWDRLWVVRERIRPLEWGEVSVPERPARDRAEESLEYGPPQVAIVSAPSWADAAWSLLDTDRTIADALAGYYEGLSLFWDHPSFALIAFVGAVEAIGAKLVALKRCKQCSSLVGAGRRFRAALQLARSVEESKALAKTYGPRSKTAHEGRLYGAENVLGTFLHPGVMTNRPESEFTWGQVYRMKSASRDLLLMALQGQLPEALSLEGTDFEE